MRRFPARRPSLEEAAADPDNIVMTPAESGLRFPFVIYGGGQAIGEAFGELASQPASTVSQSPKNPVRVDRTLTVN